VKFRLALNGTSGLARFRKASGVYKALLRLKCILALVIGTKHFGSYNGLPSAQVRTAQNQAHCSGIEHICRDVTSVGGAPHPCLGSLVIVLLGVGNSSYLALHIGGAERGLQLRHN
jgi:hypothetical protein